MEPTTDDVATGSPTPADATESPLTAFPTLAEEGEQWRQYYEAHEAGVIDPDMLHSKEFVAVYDGRVIGYGPDPSDLRQRAATGLGIHPARIIVSALGDYDCLEVLSPALW
jgi:hypothetical protein